MTTPQDPWSNPPADAAAPSQGYPQAGPQPGYVPPAYPQGGYAPPPTYSQGGYAPEAYPQGAYPPGAYPQGVYPPGAHPQGGGYPTAPFPAYTGSGMGQAPRPETPSIVNGAFWLWMASLAVGVLTSVLLLSDGYFERVADVVSGLDGATAEVLERFGSTFYVMTTIVSIAISLFIYLFFGLMMRGGRNWARVVLTVVGAFAVLSTLSGGAQAATLVVGDSSVSVPGEVASLGWLGTLAAALAIVLMYLPPANMYFRAAKAHRATR